MQFCLYDFLAPSAAVAGLAHHGVSTQLPSPLPHDVIMVTDHTASTPGISGGVFISFSPIKSRRSSFTPNRVPRLIAPPSDDNLQLQQRQQNSYQQFITCSPLVCPSNANASRLQCKDDGIDALATKKGNLFYRYKMKVGKRKNDFTASAAANSQQVTASVFVSPEKKRKTSTQSDIKSAQAPLNRHPSHPPWLTDDAWRQQCLEESRILQEQYLKSSYNTPDPPQVQSSPCAERIEQSVARLMATSSTAEKTVHA